MGHNAKCCCLAVILLCTAAIGPPGLQADLTEKQVYPLEKQEDVWWAGVRDLCELAGAELTATAGGPVILQRDLGGEGNRHLGFRIEAFADQLMGKGPIEIKVGDDTYKLEVGSVKLERDGERVWDLIHEQSARGVGVLVTTHYMQEAQQCDRLLLMSRGSLVAAGSEADIIGDITAVAVRADDWSAAFSALDEAGQAVTLAGRRVRVADGRPDRIRRLLAERGIAAEVAVVPATIEERMTLLTRADL